MLLAAVASCSGSREFRLDVASDDIGTQNVTLVYYSDGAYKAQTVSAIDGKFTVIGSLDAPAFIEVFVGNGTLLGELIVEGGDHVEARLSALNPENISVRGNDDAEELEEFLKDNRPLIKKNDFDALNRNIGNYIRENPRDFVSAVLLNNYYTVNGYEAEAAELLQLIPSKWREGGFTLGFEQMLSVTLASDTLAVDTVRAFAPADTAALFTPSGAPYTLLMLTDDKSRGADSIRTVVSVLRAGAPASKLRIVDFGCDRDTMLWKTALRNLPEDYPADVERLWLAAGPASADLAGAAPTDVPFFILADSAGHMVYRGCSATGARAAYGRIKR